MREMRKCLGAALIVAACLSAPLTASALSINDYQKQTGPQQAASYTNAAKEAVKEAYQVDQKFGDAVAKYFTVIPQGASETLGYTNFEVYYQRTLKDYQNNPTKLDQLQIEDLIDDVIQDSVLPTIKKQGAAPSPKAATNP